MKCNGAEVNELEYSLLLYINRKIWKVNTWALYNYLDTLGPAQLVIIVLTQKLLDLYVSESLSLK